MTERGTSFSDLQAVVQAWQPMQLSLSMTLAHLTGGVSLNAAVNPGIGRSFPYSSKRDVSDSRTARASRGPAEPRTGVPKLAQYAYLIGCQVTGEALLIDPERDIDRYVELAEAEGLRITAVTTAQWGVP